MNEQNKNNMKAGLGVFLLVLWAVVAIIACSVYFLNVGGATACAALPNIAFHAVGWETFRRKVVNPVLKK